MKLKSILSIVTLIALGGCQSIVKADPNPLVFDNNKAVEFATLQNTKPEHMENINSAPKQIVEPRLMENIVPAPKQIGNYSDLKEKYKAEFEMGSITQKQSAGKILASFEFCDGLHKQDLERSSCIANFIPIYEKNITRLSSLASYGVGGITCDGKWSPHAKRDRDGDGIECEWGESSPTPSSYRARSSGSTYVRGYYRKNGTYVRGHTRRR